MTREERIARQVWQEFAPLEGDGLAFRDGLFWITFADGVAEGFDFHIDPDDPLGLQVSILADKMQGIIMEDRQPVVPVCPLHPAAHPLGSAVVDDTAAWVCPSGQRPIRYMKVTAGAA